MDPGGSGAGGIRHRQAAGGQSGAGGAVPERGTEGIRIFDGTGKQSAEGLCHTQGHQRAVGKEAENIARIAKDNGIEHVYTFDNNKDATEKLKKIIAVDDVALIKASNSMNFKEIVASLLQH